MVTRSTKTVMATGPRQYTEEELDARRRKIPINIVACRELEDELDKEKKRLKGKIDALNSEIQELTSQIMDGYEVCEQESFVEKDYLTKTKRWRSCDSGTVIKEAPFRDGDDQMGGDEQELRPVPVDSIKGVSA